MKPKAPTEKQVFFIFDNSTFKQRPDLLINEPGRLESTFIELIFPNKRNLICSCIYKHPNMKISCFNSEYLTPLLTNVQKKEKACMFMGDFNINLLNAETNTIISEFYDNMSYHFFAPDILQRTRLTKNSKTLIDNIILNSIEFETFSRNLTSLISDHLPDVTDNIVYERNYRFFNYNGFKNDLKSIPWENILSQVNLSASSAFDLFFKQISTLLDEHAPIRKLSQKELSLKNKPWIRRSIQSLTRECDKLFKSYCQETLQLS